MNEQVIERRFAEMGARVKFAGNERTTGRVRVASRFAIDITRDRRGEEFLVRGFDAKTQEIEVVDVRPKDRHLLLMVRNLDRAEKQKFLCGHDERHWFVAAVPERANAASVQAAKDALKPAMVHREEARKGVRAKDRNRRKNAAFRRQGEWFFLPRPGMEVHESSIERNEPLRRGNGKPHKAQECFRTGGTVVYVCPQRPNGVTEYEYTRLIQANRKAKGWKWEVMRTDMQVYVRGRVSHADHKTIVLPCWHRVVMNTETEARAMRNVAFLD